MYWRGAPGSGSPGGYIQVDVVIVLLPHQIPLTHPIISARRRKFLIADVASGTVLTLLNNCKDKGRKGLHFSQQKGKIMNNSCVGIFSSSVWIRCRRRSIQAMLCYRVTGDGKPSITRWFSLHKSKWGVQLSGITGTFSVLRNYLS